MAFQDFQASQACSGRRGSHSTRPPSSSPSFPTNWHLPKRWSSAPLWALASQYFTPWWQHQAAPGDQASPFLRFSHREFLPDLDQRLKGKSLTDGIFTCDTKGVYFFSFHISAKNKVSPPLNTENPIRSNRLGAEMCRCCWSPHIGSGSRAQVSGLRFPLWPGCKARGQQVTGTRRWLLSTNDQHFPMFFHLKEKLHFSSSCVVNGGYLCSLFLLRCV